ncbi:helix-turn-helix transcriptional regulator [Micromonospora sp. NPDC005305]|uniref:ArsR/SmtB family transcription factor n=1 Tax=Micromonospora sp. NPDC005305 TaxID=3156875 RepID=UPI0033B3DA94
MMATYSDVPAPGAIELGTLLAALADPLRRGVVLDLLGRDDDEHACSSFNLPVAKSTRTYHWRILRQAGLITQRDAGNGSFVRLRRQELKSRFPGLLEAIHGAARSSQE